jgi:hypothetical protein
MAKADGLAGESCCKAFILALGSLTRARPGPSRLGPGEAESMQFLPWLKLTGLLEVIWMNISLLDLPSITALKA